MRPGNILWALPAKQILNCVGKIEILDLRSYVAIERNMA